MILPKKLLYRGSGYNVATQKVNKSPYIFP